MAWGCSNLEEFTCSQTCIRALKAIPKWKKRNGDDANPFNLKSKSMRGLDTSSLIGWGWIQWFGFQEISIDPYQGRSQAENQWIPRLAFRPVRDRLSLRSFIKRQLRPIFLCSQTSTHGPKQGFGKNSTLLPLVCEASSAQMGTSAATIFTDAWPPRLLFRLLPSKTLPFFCHNATEPGNSLKSRQ